MVKPEIVDANEVVERLGAVSARDVAPQIRVELDLDPGLWPVREGPVSLDRILMNLTATARDAASHGGGYLTIKTENVLVEQHLTGNRPGVLADNYVCITVRHNGQRITRDIINRIFDPFFSDPAPGEGARLGFGTVHGIVTRSLGIQVDTELGGGTTFRILLPAADRADKAAPKLESDSVPRADELVLVVEKTVAMRRLMSRALARAGYEVKSAPGPAKALDLLERLDRPVDVLIVDVVMPGLGKVFADRVSRRHPNVKILYMSGDPDQVESLDAGEPRSQYLHKPFTKEELVGKVKALVTESSAV